MSLSPGGASAATWNVDNGGNWSTVGNWSGGVPEGPGATAALTYNITSSRTVTINLASNTVGTLSIGDGDYTLSGSVWNSYTLAAGTGLSLVLDSGTSSAATITKIGKKYSTGTAVSDTISAPLLLDSNLQISNLCSNTGAGTTGARLLVTGGVTAKSAGTKTLTNTGAATTNGVAMSGVIGDGSGQIAVTQNSTTSALVLSGVNTYTGNTLITAGTLTVGHSLALQNSVFDTTGTGTLAFSSVTTPTFGGLTGSGNRTLASGITKLTLNPGSGVSTVYSGILGSSTAGMSLSKTGAGTQILSGANSYSGGTTVTLGTLLVDNTTGSGTGSGTVSVEAGATLGGTGSVAGALNVTGVLAPGASIQTLSSGSLAMYDGSTFACEADSSAPIGVGADLQKVLGDLSLSGIVTLSLTELGSTGFTEGTTLSLINYSGAWNNALFTYDGAFLSNGGQLTTGRNLWSIDYNAAMGGSNFDSEYIGGTDSFVNITVIPEPHSAVLGGLGLLALLRRRRKP
jgi:autotransporter-associated beta strand protein